ICKLIEDGHISLTKQSFTETKKGKKRKQAITEEEYHQILTEVGVCVAMEQNHATSISGH
ncbi:hypothetical protein ELS81_32535, partial [Bacillus sp. VKPM B-3276]